MKTSQPSQQPWISQKWIDTLFILMPPFACLLLILIFPQIFQNTKELSEAWWVAVILLVDVAHVYSTLYRTYFDPNAREKQQVLLWCIPLFSFIAGILLYSVSSIWFWRILAYVAVYHFIRQQYGFMRLYSRKERLAKLYKHIDTLSIYYATIYPIIFWHLNGPRNFNWFVQNDFMYFGFVNLLAFFTWFYYLVIVLYIAKEIILFVQKRHFNIPRNGIIVGSFMSWYFGIVYFNGDMAFTLLNVVSHGIPYMALIWIYGEKNYRKGNVRKSPLLEFIFVKKWIWLFLFLIFLFAFVEEGLWDIIVWKEHKSTFSMFHVFNISIAKDVLNILIPLLAVPQITHYIIDGFIWRIRDDNFKWNNETGKTVLRSL